MEKATINYPKGKPLKTTIILPGSKSISNRLLIIKALCDENFEIKNLSQAKDTLRLVELLSSNELNLNAQDSGTVMRFLTAYYAVTAGTRNITGSSRMLQRPIGPLVEGLTKLGAEIDYSSKNGYPPLRIKGKKLKGSSLKIDAGISSQFITAMLLIAPTFTEDVFTLELANEIVSKPYINMTLSLMRQFGISTDWNTNYIEVFKGDYSTSNLIENTFEVEPDWSSASFWYMAASLANEAEITILGLKQNSLQGDKILAEIYAMFGVVTEFTSEGIVIRKTKNTLKEIALDCSDFPDLAIPLAVNTASLGLKGIFNGLKTLKIKETDRIAALENELIKSGIVLQPNKNNSLMIYEGALKKPADAYQSYNDHRIAMAFAVTAIKNGEVEIINPNVVAKSYPNFYQDLIKSGFNVIFS
ncbi:MAG: 3-phosphoshikimate 1-carboxyvinyltransferase [Bacteroidota bacterium]|jgi:3-phosphoshikimate 1-carboxyvinyltransferase